MKNQIERVIDSLDEKGYTAFWMQKEFLQELKKQVKVKYPGASITKLSGTEYLFLFITLR